MYKNCTLTNSTTTTVYNDFFNKNFTIFIYKRNLVYVCMYVCFVFVLCTFIRIGKKMRKTAHQTHIHARTHTHIICSIYVYILEKKNKKKRVWKNENFSLAPYLASNYMYFNFYVQCTGICW